MTTRSEPPQDQAGPAGLDELRRLEGGLWQQATRGDRAWTDRVLHPDFAEHGRSGRVWTREQVLAMTVGPLETELVDLRTALLAPGVALLTYVALVGPGPVQRSTHTSVWVLDGPGWRLRFHQGTPAPEG